jgi:hypothetical protein
VNDSNRLLAPQHLRKQFAQMLTGISTPSALMTIPMRLGIGAEFELRFSGQALNAICASARRDRARRTRLCLPDRLVHHPRSRSCRTNSSPSGHGPKPASVFRCPDAPATRKSLLHCVAIRCATASSHLGSFVLATNRLRNGSGFIGTGRKSATSTGASGASRSGGAISKVA